LKTLAKLIFFLIVVAAALVGYGIFLPAGPRSDQFVLLKPGSTARKIARDLKANGLIRSEYAFLAVHAWKAKSLKAGEYRFSQPANALEVYDRVARGDIVVHTVTIPEGYNIFDVAVLMEQAGLGARADFLALARDQAFVASVIGDLDPQGHVNQAVFLTYFESGRVGMFRNQDLGIGVPGATFVLVRVMHLPARLFVLPDAIGLALFLVWRTSCQQEQQKEPVTFVLDFGDRESNILGQNYDYMAAIFNLRYEFR